MFIAQMSSLYHFLKKMSYLTDYFKELCMYCYLGSLTSDQIMILHCLNVGIGFIHGSWVASWAWVNILSVLYLRNHKVKDVDTLQGYIFVKGCKRVMS